jgi:hypothetical protein
MAQRYPEARSGGAKDFRPGSAGAVEKKGLTSGVHASARGEREGADDGRREIKKKTACAKYAKAGAGWPAGPRRVGPVGRPRPGKWQAGWAEVRVGRKVGRAESEEERFLN